MPFLFLIYSWPSIRMEYESWTILSRIASANVPSPIFPCQPAVENWEQNIVEAFLCLDSIISSKSLACVFVNGTNSHSSNISNATFL